MRRYIDASLNGMIILLVVGVAYLAVQPQSPFRAKWNEYAENRAIRQAITKSWPELRVGGPRRDSTADSVTLVEFSDYECPFCRRMEATIDSAVARRTIALSFHHFPLSIHPGADGAARASICAESQGRFFQMHSRLMTTTQWQRDSNWVREATNSGVHDLQAFRNCLTSDSTRHRLDRDIALAERLKINATPAFVSSTGRVLGAISLVELESLGRQSRAR